MPAALFELQAAFADYLQDGDDVTLAAMVVSDAIPSAGRLRIHRNHVRTSLTAALSSTFPVVHRLVGEAFFDSVAATYFRRELPRTPVLAEYGASFPDHLAADDRLTALPYIADVGRLEWALNVAWLSAWTPPLSAVGLSELASRAGDIPPIALRRGTGLVQSAWPVDRIWNANRSAAEPETMELRSEPTHLLIFRTADDAAFAGLSAEEAALVRQFEGTSPPVQPAGLTDVDVPAGLARLLALGVLAAPVGETRG